MRRKTDPLPTTPRSLWEAIRQIQRDIQELRAARTLQAATIGAGGLTIAGGGALTVVTPTGQETFLVGAFPPGYNHSDGSSQLGMQLWRESGTTAFALFSAVGDPNGQAWTWYDISGNIIFAEDEASAQGLGRPYLDASGWFGATETPAWTTTSGTFTTVMNLPWIKQHPRVTANFLVQCAAGVAGEIRLVDDAGTQIGATQVIPAASYFYGSLTGTIAGSHMLSTFLHWQARVTSGSGTIGVKGLSTFGVQS